MIAVRSKFISQLFSLSQKNCVSSSLSIHTNVNGKQGKFNPSEFIPKNVITHRNAANQPDTGRPYDKKPFKMLLKKDTIYHWCLCGWSKTQPFCDGTHKSPFLKITLKPVSFKVEEDKEYWICNCKQTKHRPFCDGSHKSEEVQEKLKFA